MGYYRTEVPDIAVDTAFGWTAMKTVDCYDCTDYYDYTYSTSTYYDIANSYFTPFHYQFHETLPCT